MRTHMLLLAMVCAALPASAADSPNCLPRFRLELLSTTESDLFPSGPYPRGMNGKGTIVGDAFENGIPSAFLWRQGQKQAVNLSAAQPSIRPIIAESINDHGAVTGYATYTDELGLARIRGYVLHRGQIRQIGALPDEGEIPREGGHSYALDINNQGQVVGYSYRSFRVTEAFLWENGNFMSLGDLPGGRTDALALSINNHGVVVGYGSVNDEPAPQRFRPFIWRDGLMRELPLPRDVVSGFATAVNDAGTVLGAVNTTPDGSDGYAVVWTSGRPKRVRSLPGYGGGPSDVNDKGDMVGGSGNRAGRNIATLWIKGVPYDLNTLIADNDPLKHCIVLTAAEAINNARIIAANGENRCDGTYVNTVRLIPIKHPAR